jgi:hypothetical protein
MYKSVYIYTAPMKKYLISVLVLLVIMTSVQISSAAIALNITSDHYINISGMKVYPIGLQAICSGSPEEGGWSNTTECLNTLNENIRIVLLIYRIL